MEFAAANAGLEVPDPYYGGNEGFERALDLIESAVDGVIREIRTKAG
jgi:protein-tyrosine phosphatase